MAWDKIRRPKVEGGLDLHPLREQARLLKICNVTKLMLNKDTEWVWMSQDLIRRSLNTGADKRETKVWSTQEFLLLNPKIAVHSRTLRYVLEGWKDVRKRLQIVQVDSTIPTSLSVHQAFILSRYNAGKAKAEDLRALKLWCGQLSIYSAANCVWRSLVSREVPDISQWNRHWGGAESPRDWMKRFQKLWTGLGHPQT
jgi:hypothetical protein